MKNATRCLSHGAATPGAILAANTRALMKADPLMAKLHAIAFDDTKPPAVQLEAIKQGLLHAGFGGTKRIELDAIVSDKKTFEDYVGEILVDVEETDDGDLFVDYGGGKTRIIAKDRDIKDAVVVEDDDLPIVNRHDRALAVSVERARPRARPGAISEAERKRMEEDAREAFAAIGLTTPTAAGVRAPVQNTRGREVFLTVLDQGGSHDEANAAARAAVEGKHDTGQRRARSTEATFSSDRPRKRRQL